MGNILIAGYEQQTQNYINAFRGLGAYAKASLDLETAGWCDALVLPGGGDVSPAFWGEADCIGTKPDTQLDSIQFAILHRAIQRQIPVLGICKGHQIIAVYFGGTLHQHLSAAQDHVGRMGQDALHTVKTKPGSLLAQLYGTELTVNSWHHQGIADTGYGMTETAWWQNEALHGEKVTEAAEHMTLPVVSVQWHPERMCGGFRQRGAADGSVLLRYFLKMTGEV